MAFENVSLATAIKKQADLRAAFLLNPNSVWPKNRFNFDFFPATGANVRYVRKNAIGGSSGLLNTEAGAWTLAEFIANQAAVSALGNCRTIFTGDFNSTNFTITCNNTLLDCRLATFTVSAPVAQSSISATGTNGEYVFRSGVSGTVQAQFGFFEDKFRLNGLNGYGSTANINYLSTTSNTISADQVCRPLVEGDIIGVMGTINAGQLNTGTPYYVKNPVTNSDGTATFQVSTTRSGTPGNWTAGTAVTITDGVQSNKKMWCLFTDGYSQRWHIPIPGFLLPGEYAFVPWDAGGAAIYFKPSSGIPSQHSYSWIQTTGTAGDTVTVTGATNNHILGGEFWGSNNLVIRHGAGCVNCGTWGTYAHSGVDGNLGDGAVNSQYRFDVVSDTARHGFGSINTVTPEPSQQITNIDIHDVGQLSMDWGDSQGIVTNKNSHGCFISDFVSYRIGRNPVDVQIYAAANAYTCTHLQIDNSSDCRVRNGYFSVTAGQAISVASTASSGIVGSNRNIYQNLVFDFRNWVGPYDPNSAGAIAAFRVLVTGASGPPSDRTNVCENSLFFLGNGDNSTAGNLQVPAAMFSLRNVGTGSPPECGMTVRNNVFYGGYGTQSTVYGLRKSAATALPIIDANGNVYCCPNLAYCAWETTNGTSISTSWDMAHVIGGGGGTWSGDRGNEVNGRVVTEDVLNTYYDKWGVPLSIQNKTGIQRAPLVDWNGVLQPNPPTPGIYSWSVPTVSLMS